MYITRFLRHLYFCMLLLFMALCSRGATRTVEHTDAWSDPGFHEGGMVLKRHVVDFKKMIGKQKRL